MNSPKKLRMLVPFYRSRHFVLPISHPCDKILEHHQIISITWRNFNRIVEAVHISCGLDLWVMGYYK